MQVTGMKQLTEPDDGKQMEGRVGGLERRKQHEEAHLPSAVGTQSGNGIVQLHAMSSTAAWCKCGL